MKFEPIHMVDLRSQHERLRKEIEPAMQAVLEQCAFINGPQVNEFSGHLADYLGVPYVIPCANGTDALQIALMALGLTPGDEVIVPAFTYVAAAEVILLLGMTPVLVDVDPYTFNLNPLKIEEAISHKTRAIIAVHLFGQCCDLEPIQQIALYHHLYLIEDNAQSIGAEYTFPDGIVKKAGTVGHIGTTSFFPSKPLACYGDGGALFTSDAALARQIRKIATHGQDKKYHHEIIGCNSRLDTLQAAILEVKLRHLDEFTLARRQVAARYDEALCDQKGLSIPAKNAFSSHIYHQYTLLLDKRIRNEVQSTLTYKGIPTMIYYPLPLQAQEAFKGKVRMVGDLDVATHLCKSVLSLPIHTEMKEEEQTYIIESLQACL